MRSSAIARSGSDRTKTKPLNQLVEPTPGRARQRLRREFQEEKAISLRLLKSVYNTVNRFIDYFNNVDPMERNDDGKPIYKAKDIMDEVNKLDMVTESLVKLEMKVKSQMNETGNIRGGEVDGYLPK